MVLATPTAEGLYFCHSPLYLNCGEVINGRGYTSTVPVQHIIKPPPSSQGRLYYGRVLAASDAAKTGQNGESSTNIRFIFLCYTNVPLILYVT